MNYILNLNSEERDLLLQELIEITRDVEFYDKDMANQLLNKVLYARIIRPEDYSKGENI